MTTQTHNAVNNNVESDNEEANVREFKISGVVTQDGRGVRGNRFAGIVNIAGKLDGEDVEVVAFAYPRVRKNGTKSYAALDFVRKQLKAGDRVTVRGGGARKEDGSVTIFRNAYIRKHGSAPAQAVAA